MKSAAVVLLALALLVPPASRAADGASAEIVALLNGQAASWNAGDIPAFMTAYAKTDDLRFASGGDVTRGWQATLDRYLKRYPDTKAMGTLTFDRLEVTPLAPDAAVVFGHWRLARGQDAPHGLFTLTLRKTPEGWRITQDHTSSAEP